MWCLSVYTLKTLISIGIVLTLLMGVILLYILIYAFIHSSILGQLENNFLTLFTIIFLITSIFMIANSLIGIYGLIRKKYQLVLVYTILIIVYFIIFLLIGIFIFQYPSQLNQTCQENNQNSFQITVNQANNTLCKSIQCCWNKHDTYTMKQINILNQMGARNFTMMNCTEQNPINAQNNPSWNNNTYLHTQTLNMLEQAFQCSGWCSISPQNNLYYFFSDINKGKPTTNCALALLQFYNNFGIIIGVSSLIASFILLLIIVNIISLFCHPKLKHDYDTLKFFQVTWSINQSQLDHSNNSILDTNKSIHNQLIQGKRQLNLTTN